MNRPLAQQKEVLSKGLNFTLTPTRFHMVDTIAAVEEVQGNCSTKMWRTCKDGSVGSWGRASYTSTTS